MANATTPVIQINEGNVGIGTASPISHSPTRKTLVVADTANGANVEIWGNSAGGKSILQSVGGNTYMGNLRSGNGSGVTFITSGEGSTYTTILANGNLGIGTTSPNNLIEISKTVDSAIGPILQLTNSQYSNANDSGSSIQFRGYTVWGPGSTNPRYSEINAINGGGSVPKRIEFKFYADTDVKTPLAILQTGSVGIGNTSPDEKLEVSGSSATDYPSIKISNPGQTGRYMRIGMIDSINHCIEANGGSTYLTFKTNATEQMRITSAGFVGIDQTNPTNQLHVHANTDNAYAIRIEGSTNNGSGVWTGLGIGGESTNTKSALLFEDIGVSYARGKLHLCVNNELNQNSATPSDAKLTVSNDGNVGIGRTSPGAKLDVNGTVQALQLSLDNTAGVNYLSVGTYSSQAYFYGYQSGNTIHFGQPATYVQNIQVQGTITASADVVAYSDERLKSNIKTLDGSKVYEMRGVSFDKDGKKSSGVIAQEMEKVAPELVKDGEYKAVAYGNISGYLIEAIKELKAEIDLLKSKPCTCNKCNCNI